MAAPTSIATRLFKLANGGPSTHGSLPIIRRVLTLGRLVSCGKARKLVGFRSVKHESHRLSRSPSVLLLCGNDPKRFGRNGERAVTT